MSGIKVTAADRWFSLAIRERDNWTCQRCNRQYPESGARGLDCSHWITRGNWATRFSPLNAVPHCVGCHFHLGAHPREHEALIREHLGPILFAALEEASQDISRARRARREVKDIATHYRLQYHRMCSERAGGYTGRIEIVGWD